MLLSVMMLTCSGHSRNGKGTAGEQVRSPFLAAQGFWGIMEYTVLQIFLLECSSSSSTRGVQSAPKAGRFGARVGDTTAIIDFLWL